MEEHTPEKKNKQTKSSTRSLYKGGEGGRGKGERGGGEGRTRVLLALII